VASWCALARISLADALALAKTSSASSAALAQISFASFLAYSWCSAACQSRRRHLSVAWWIRAQPSSRRACLAARALATSFWKVSAMASRTLAHTSSASV
jgi:hypothetical protein